MDRDRAPCSTLGSQRIVSTRKKMAPQRAIIGSENLNQNSGI